jgi:hypothetical protein
MLLSLKQFETKLVSLILRHHCRLKMWHRCRLTLVMRHWGILYGLRHRCRLTLHSKRIQRMQGWNPILFLFIRALMRLRHLCRLIMRPRCRLLTLVMRHLCRLVVQCHTTTHVVSCCSFNEAVRDQSSHLDYTAHHWAVAALVPSYIAALLPSFILVVMFVVTILLVIEH